MQSREKALGGLEDWRGLLLLSGIVFSLLCWACTGTARGEAIEVASPEERGLTASDSTLVGKLVYEIQIGDDGIWASCTHGNTRLRKHERGFTSGDLDMDGIVVVQRVDGWAIGMEEAYENLHRLAPRLNAWQLYSVTSHEWLYEFRFEQPLFNPFSFSFGASMYKKTATFEGDEERISREENSLAAAFLKRDYRDYYRKTGVSAFVSQRFSDYALIRIEYADDQIDPLDAFNTIWTVFRKGESFGRNLQADPGHMMTLSAMLELDTRPEEDDPSGGQWHRLYLKQAGQGLGGDYDFTKWKLDSRNYIVLSANQFLDYRVMAGGMLGPERQTLPVQERFRLGGLGTMRAHDFKSLSGDEMFLMNIEYGVEVKSDFQALVFVDTGNAWEREEPFFEQRLDLDAGVGIRSSDGDVGLYFARDLRDRGRKAKFTFRIRRTF